MPTASDDPAATAEQEALAWVGRLRAPDGTRYQAEFETWFMKDPLHADAYERVLKSWDRFDIVGKTPVGKSRLSFFAAAPSAQRRRYAIGAMAAVMLIALVGLGAGPFGFAPNALIPAAYASGMGQIRTLTLADGSRMTLDTNSAVEVAFTVRERRLRVVRGRARFKVARDSTRPFVVDAGGNAVTATATEFDIDLASDRLAVALLEGSLRVEGSAGSPKISKILTAGQTVSFSHDAPAGRTGVVDAAEVRWPSGMLSFENAGLADVVERTNRYAVLKVILTDDTARHLRFTGTFRPTDTDAFARMLAAMFKLTLTRDDTGNYLLGASAG
ncbi:MAG: FecR domain-containing protein [Sphingomonas sp.]